jgi:sulfate/thiosulfate-binding protein
MLIQITDGSVKILRRFNRRKILEFINRRRQTRRAKIIAFALAMLALISVGSCLPTPQSSGEGATTLTVYCFSIMKEPLEKEIFPAFASKWKQEHGQSVNFTASYAGSETVTNQIIQGAPAELALLSIERDAMRLKQNGAMTSDYKSLPNQGIVNKTPFIILVRKGNPHNIRDFPDLAKPGVKVIHPDPLSSGGAQWSILAIYGSELLKSEKQTGARDAGRAVRTLQAIWRNVISTPGSAREARTQFETGYGDALITYELEGLLMKEAGASVEIVVPQATIFSEHPAVIVDRNVTTAKRPVVEAFLRYLWSDEAQRAFVKYHLRSVTDEKLNKAHQQFARIEMPFGVELFGGWQRAYSDVIEGVWRNQVQRK